MRHSIRRARLKVKGRLAYLLDGLGGLLGEVPHQALQDGPGDVLLELGFVHGWATGDQGKRFNPLQGLRYVRDQRLRAHVGKGSESQVGDGGRCDAAEDRRRDSLLEVKASDRWAGRNGGRYAGRDARRHAPDDVVKIKLKGLFV